MKDCVSPYVRESKTVLDSGFQALDSSLCQWDLDSEFQYLVGFRILQLYSGFHKQTFPGFWNPNSLTCILQSRRILWCQGFGRWIWQRVGASQKMIQRERLSWWRPRSMYLGVALSFKKKRGRICLLCSLPYIGWCVVKIKLLMVAWAKNNSDLVWELLLSNWFYYLLINNKYTVYKRHK